MKQNKYNADMLLNENFENLIMKLRNDYYMNALKIDFASEVVTEKELEVYSILAKKTNTNLTIKIGGCEAIRDIYFAKKYGVNGILIPMIETEYSLIKAIENIKKIFNNISDVNIYINIETETGVDNFDYIMSAASCEHIRGIVLGRDDLTNSVGLDISLINSDKILNIAKMISGKTFKYNKEFIIGGKILPDAEEFLKKIPRSKLSKIETRRVIFNKNIIDSKIYKNGVAAALKFEYLWLRQFGLNNKITKQRLFNMEQILLNDV